MNSFKYIFYIFLAFVFCSNLLAEEDFLNVDTILINIDPDKVNKAEVKEYFKDIHWKTAKGEGKVINILPANKDTFRIRILTKASNPEKGYNVVLFTTQNATTDISEGDIIIFEGKVERINAFQGASIDIHGTYRKKTIEK